MELAFVVDLDRNDGAELASFEETYCSRQQSGVCLEGRLA
jgi:hypothetical protein